MNKQRQLILVILALIAALSLVTGSVAARATKTEFTGTVTVLEVGYPGIWTFPGGNIHFRGRVLGEHYVTGDARVDGDWTVVVNANLDPYGVGPMWGTMQQATKDGDARWKGTWTGYFHADGSISIRGVSQGKEGSVDGLKMFLTVEYAKWGDLPIAGTISGHILDPHGD